MTRTKDATIAVLLVDDHPMVLLGLQTVLDDAPDIEVVGLAGGGAEGVAAFERDRPEVVVMDLSMPGSDGLEAMRQILAASPEARVLVLSSSSDEDTVATAMRAGAAGYVLKDSDPEELMRAIRAAARGELPVDPRVTRSLLRSEPQRSDELTLTQREHDVLRLLQKGLANKQIALRLGIGESTVKSHLSSAFQRIGVADRTAAALWAHHHLDEVTVR